MEYIIVALGCFLLGIYYKSSDVNRFELNIMQNVKAGKRVIICVEDEATILERVGNNVRITKAMMKVAMENDDAVVHDNPSPEFGDSSPPILPH
jgi:hypothetical protein